MRLKTIRVPGKVMLSGEYAVLYGGTAALTTVPRYLSVNESVVPVPQNQTPITEGALRCRIDETVQYEQEHGLPHLSIDQSEFLHEDRAGKTVKLGLGSSAAEAVGVVALRFERSGFVWSENREKIAEYAIKIHSEVQGGRGSGADVAVCAYREPVKFRRDEGRYSVEPICKSAAVISLHLVWTGYPSDTRVMIGGFDSWSRNRRLRARDPLSDLVDSSHRIADAWFTVSKEALFEELDRFCSRLDACMEAAKLQHKLPIHYELENWARSHGGRAKPTGAGGGDMVLLIGDLPVDELDMMAMPIEQ